jgi:hypothetical protein
MTDDSWWSVTTLTTVIGDNTDHGQRENTDHGYRQHRQMTVN